ncbi:uncharacterized protein BX663DRAFT_261178 [Cokeromyces recurvatus]|uniref:uncharacterized protein n=1 Tax=Cokeromyces recurvatus TaxID=90255 RepID=UPI00221FEAC0|nr:uncharacterized protein BX663DRAFT_261178 [Cokeromyces recurvatus]KAI7898368.1 hypothetical protein BX663DRAFT_261178 [Cokeromyces recurvatus]
MGNATSKELLIRHSLNSHPDQLQHITIDLYSTDSINQLLKTYFINQKLSDILKHPASTLFSTTLLLSPIEIEKVTNKEKFYCSLLNQQQTIVVRVWVAQCKLYGFGTSKDLDKGFRLLYQLKDHQESWYPLGCYYFDKKEDYTQAYHYFNLLRKHNDLAQYRLALMMLYGQGIPQNLQRGFYYLRLSADNNNKYAQFILGFCYEHGILVKSSMREAKKWYERSANQGFAEAQTHLANLLLIIHPLLTMTVNAEENGIISKLLANKYDYIKKEILEWLEKAKDQNNANALIRLGALYEEGTLVLKDTEKSLKYYKRATKAPYTSSSIKALAHYLVGVHYRSNNLDNSLAFEQFSISAETGYAPAQRTLGIMYLEGITVSKDTIKAENFFQLAASQGDIRSIGFLNEQQRSVISLYEYAAKAGSLNAQLTLAELLQHVGQHSLAYKWFKIASKNTSTQDSILDLHVGWRIQQNTARLMVARYQYNGWGNVSQDCDKAFNEFRTLSENGFFDAHYWLAACYEEGVKAKDGSWLVNQDLALAFDVYVKSAEAGDRDGQFQVAYMLSNGVGGIEKNVEEAFEWYMKAAEQGHRTAQYSLGLYYEYGLVGIPVNLEKAKGWYTLAAQELTTAMVKLANVLIKMDNAKILEAVNWLKKAIEKGDIIALRELANLYINGLIDNHHTIKKSSLEHFRIAYNYYKTAADKGDALSWYALSKFFEGAYDAADEIVVPTNLEKAIQCLKKAEELGYEAAVLDLADLYYRNNMVRDTMNIYISLANSSNNMSYIANKAKIEAAKIVIFENYGKGADKKQAYVWLKDWLSFATTEKLHEDNTTKRLLVETYELLGYCSEHGIGTVVNKEEAIQYYIKCVDTEEGKEEITNEGYSSIQQHKKHQHWAKQRSLCRLVYHSMEKEDYRSAFVYLQLLKPDLDEMSKLQFSDAQYQARRMKYYIGFLLIHGLGVKKSVHESLIWLGDAADEGDGDAAYELGCILAQQQDDDLENEVRQRFKQGVSANHAGCMRELALILLSDEEGCFSGVITGNEEKEDAEGTANEIIELLKNASKLGDIESTYQLGYIYENGFFHIIPEKDIGKALDYYLKAASQNHELSILKAGEILGSNSLNQHEEAIQWFQKAAAMYDNIKAKVMLISYRFQGFFTTEDDHDDNKNHEQSFEILKGLVDEGLAILEIEANSSNEYDEEEDWVQKRIQKEKLVMKKEGLGLALYILGQCYELGKGTNVDLQIAKNCYYRSIDISQHVDSMWRLGVIYNESENNDSSALEWFRKAVEKGNHRESHYQLGLFHLKGRGGLEANVAVAKKHFSKAVEQGHPLATFELAHIVWNIHHDHLYAYELYKAAGKQLHVPAALRELGHLSHTGFNVQNIQIIEQDHKQAFAYYREAAKLGDPIGALMVGTYFEEGYLKEELGQDLERALEWYESAYKLNCGSLSELAIGKIKHLMANLVTDINQAEDMREEAFKWFERVANTNQLSSYSVKAKIMIALYYINGWGHRPHDPEKGFQMLLSIENCSNSLEAIIAIAKCYEEGIGVEYDMMKAKAYWEIAAEKNNKEALVRLGDIYELGLTGTINRKMANQYYNKAKLIESKTKENQDYYISRRNL